MKDQTSSGNLKTVLFCPLDWGLGHASRDIYIIHRLKQEKFNIIIGADKAPLHLLKSEFPDLQFIRFPFPSIKYSRIFPLPVKILFSVPRLIFGILREHQYLKTLILKHNVDIVISDNRYGLWNKHVQTVFITHQLRIRFPKIIKLLEPLFFYLTSHIIQKYDYCWVPDFPEARGLAGVLSHPEKTPSNIHYIGPISRFLLEKHEHSSKLIKKFDVVAILSGPEPQRTILENLLIRQLRKEKYTVLIVRGLPWKKQGQTIYQNIQLVSHLNTNLLADYIKEAKFVICRSGYSSVMDLSILGKKAILIPTPGQTEQEYLAEFLHKQKFYLKGNQKELELVTSFKELARYKPVLPGINSKWLDDRIRLLLEI